MNIEGSHLDSQDFQNNVIYYLELQAPLKSCHARLTWQKNWSVREGEIWPIFRFGLLHIRIVIRTPADRQLGF